MAAVMKDSDPREIVQVLKNFQADSSEQNKKILITTLLKPGVSFMMPCAQTGTRKAPRWTPVVLNTKNGKQVFPLYTSQNEMMKNPYFDVNWRIMKLTISMAGSILEKADNVDAVSINPFGINFATTPQFLLDLKTEADKMEAKIQEQLQAGLIPQHIELHALKPEVAEKVSAALTPVLQAEPAVQKAWAYLSSTENLVDHSTQTQFFLCLDAEGYTEDQQNALRDKAAVIVRPLLHKMDSAVVVLASEESGQQMAQSGEPFYTAL